MAAYTKRRKRRFSYKDKRQRGGVEPQAKMPITIGIVCWKSPKTITSTLNSYKKHGLFDLVHPILYIQERTPKYEKIGIDHGIQEIMGTSENLGILQAFIALIEATKTKYFIFAECDFKLVHDNATTEKVLGEAIRLIEEENVQVVRLRDRKNPGDPMIAEMIAGVNEMSDEERNKHVYDQNFAYKLESVMFLEHPDKAFPNVFKTIDYSSRWYTCSDKGCAPWSNNIFIAPTAFMKEKILPLLMKRPGVNAQGRNDDVFAKLEFYLGEHLTNYTVAQGPGLFTHERHDRGNSNTQGGGTRKNQRNNVMNRGKPLFKRVYAITMNPESERYKQTIASAKEANVDVEKWDAVKVDDTMGNSLMEQGIGSIIFKGPKMRYRGAIGCFLAHRGLMRHIEKNPTTDAHGTLILEDDVKFEPDFATKLQNLTNEIPNDWDIIYLDKVNPKAAAVSANVEKFEKQMTASNNWGNWAYIVRQRSLPKILAKLEFMIDPVDLQLHKFADSLNIYLAKPSLVTLNDKTTYNSNINKLNQ
jgi:GR25 family glycosyltransferase involved in LPS biosynthesis